MGNTIELLNPGPISGSFKIDLSKGPGVYELTGSKGLGKSTVISCIELLAGHRVDVTVHDGELEGSVSGFGSVVPIGGKKRRKGELEVETLDSEKFSVSDVIDPPLKGDGPRDSHRIKALASLCGAVANPADYYSLIGDQESFEKIVTAGKLATEDPVLLASRIKEAFESQARISESRRDTESAHADACKPPADLDLDTPHDAPELATAAEMAAADLKALQDHREAANTAKIEASNSAVQLDTLKKTYYGPTVEVAHGQYAVACSEAERASEDAKCAGNFFEEARRALAKAESERDKFVLLLRAASDRMEASGQACKAATHHRDLVAQIEQQIASRNAVLSPDEIEISDAIAARDAARAANELGVRVRDALSGIDRRNKHLARSAEAELEAKRMRDAAASTFSVLTKSVKLDKIAIESVDGNPRLVVKHPRREGKVLFDALSDGERVKTVIDELFKYIGKPGLFPIAQRIWQDLPPSDRLDVHHHATSMQCYACAARVTDGPLRVRHYSEPEETTLTSPQQTLFKE
jgi:hypothetical protein